MQLYTCGRERREPLVAWQHLVGVEDAVGVHDRLELLHELDALVALGHVEVLALHGAEAVLRGDGPALLPSPLEDPGLDLVEDRVGGLGRGDVEVQVAVADVPVAHHRRLLAVEARARVLHQVVELRQGQGDVVLVHGARLGQGLGDALADAPDALHLHRVRGEGAVGHLPPLHHRLEESVELFRVVFLVASAHFDEHVEGRAGLERVARPVQVLQSQVQRLVVEELHGGEDLREVALSLLEDGEHRLVRVHGEVGQLHARRQLGEGERDARDNAECALRPDEELLEVVPRIVFLESVEVIDDRAVSEDRLDAKHRAVQRAVAQEAQAARVGGNVAANVARALGAEVEGYGVALGLNSLLQLLQHHTRLAGGSARELVHGEHLVHAREREHNLILDCN
mmetsp:Transcript_16768/g.48602  ORF Transcript_16768/g.48602 Transcript_16768/m.48602 type:complete len:398 (-) Transcript_16768:371-1564(-)